MAWRGTTARGIGLRERCDQHKQQQHHHSRNTTAGSSNFPIFAMDPEEDTEQNTRALDHCIDADRLKNILDELPKLKDIKQHVIDFPSLCRYIRVLSFNTSCIYTYNVTNILFIHTKDLISVSILCRYPSEVSRAAVSAGPASRSDCATPAIALIVSQRLSSLLSLSSHATWMSRHTHATPHFFFSTR